MIEYGIFSSHLPNCSPAVGLRAILEDTKALFSLLHQPSLEVERKTQIEDWGILLCFGPFGLLCVANKNPLHSKGCILNSTVNEE